MRDRRLDALTDERFCPGPAQRGHPRRGSQTLRRRWKKPARDWIEPRRAAGCLRWRGLVDRARFRAIVNLPTPENPTRQMTREVTGFMRRILPKFALSGYDEARPRPRYQTAASPNFGDL